MTYYTILKDQTKEWEGRKLYRVKALRPFNGVAEGTIGGWIEKPENLAQSGAWVGNDAIVCGDSTVEDASQVDGSAAVVVDSRVAGQSHIAARFLGRGVRAESSTVYNSQAYGATKIVRSLIYGCKLTGDASVVDSTCYNAQAEEYSSIVESRLFGRARTFGNAKVFKTVLSCGSLTIRDSAVVSDSLLSGTFDVEDEGKIEDSYVYGTVVVFGKAAFRNFTSYQETPINVSVGKSARIRSFDDFLTIGPIDDAGDVATFYRSGRGVYVASKFYSGSVSNFVQKASKTPDGTTFYRAFAAVATSKLQSRKG
jgi:hypothetical protein